MAPSNELKLLYKSIAEQIEITKEKHQQVLMLGDETIFQATKKQCQKEEDRSEELKNIKRK